VFRGFTNVGADDGVLLTVLGQDDTGGIIWGPSVLEEAASHGLYLTADNRLIDTIAGDQVAEGVALIRPMPRAEIDRLDSFDVDQFRARVTTKAERTWIERPFLCSELPGGRAELSLVIGYGISEDRRAVPRLHEPHSFNLGWLKASPGEGMLTHRHAKTQVVTARSGRWQIRLNRGDDELLVELDHLDSLSVPAGAWRSFTLLETPDADGGGELLVVNGGDGRTRLEWDPSVVQAAQSAGVVLDPNGYRAPAAVLATATEDD
jgi:hypothetical protein